MTAHDPSMSDAALYGSTLWVATTLGMSKDSFFRRRADLEAHGFPRRDPLTNLWLKADVDAWIAKRRRIADDEAAKPEASTPNFDNL
jgi:predicted DNA-binding transcriptional regulator AlpA